MRRWLVCVGLDFEDVEVKAERHWYSQDTGWLTFGGGAGEGHTAVFAPGKWLYFQEVFDVPATH